MLQTFENKNMQVGEDFRPSDKMESNGLISAGVGTNEQNLDQDTKRNNNQTTERKNVPEPKIEKKIVQNPVPHLDLKEKVLEEEEDPEFDEEEGSFDDKTLRNTEKTERPLEEEKSDTKELSIENIPPPPPLVPFSIEIFSGINFPDNTNLCKIYVALVNSDDRILSQMSYKLCDLDSDLFNPDFDLKIRVNKSRLLENNKLALFTMLLTMDDTMNQSFNGKQSFGSILGFSITNLYVETIPEEGRPPGPDTLHFKLLEGDWTIPIYFPQLTPVPISEIFSRIRK